MKIIKKGKLPQKVITTLSGKCENCGCVFETHELDKEVLPLSNPDPKIFLSTKFQRICPTKDCGKMVDLMWLGGCNEDCLEKYYGKLL